MPRLPIRVYLFGLVFLAFSIACNLTGVGQNNLPEAPAATPIQSEDATPIPTPPAPSLLTICMGQEPQSLFIYSDASVAARSLRQAIYDGPADVLAYAARPVILAESPSLENGAIAFEPVAVGASNIIADSTNRVVAFASGVEYRPAGCASPDCARVYDGQEVVQMDQMVIRFRLQAGLRWSDGAPLTASDSQYSFEVARSLYPRARGDLIARTQSYRAQDEVVVEWRGIPGYRQAETLSIFFTPLPRHVWGGIAPEDLLSAPLSNRQPIGWGAYAIQEWTPGDHISLERNPYYARSAEGLPYFERLVFRFTPDKEEAVKALLVGECDYLDETVGIDPQDARLLEAQQQGQITLVFAPGSAWEQLSFGVQPFSQEENALTPFFQSKETRQAFAYCIDRQRLAEQLFQGQSQVPDSYLPAEHPYFNPDIQRYPFNPQTGAALLEAAGWIDDDGDPNTPRRAQNVTGVTDGEPFVVTLLTTQESEKQKAAEFIHQSLAGCGVQIEIESIPWQTLLAAGPEGPVFGRNFSLAQFAWTTSLQPPCFLYVSDEIPGPYPQYPKGWGGANASGFSDQAFDDACQQAGLGLVGTPEYQTAHFQAQTIFAEQLPSLPLYLRWKMVAARADLCGLLLDASTDSALWNLEQFGYGEFCP